MSRRSTARTALAVAASVGMLALLAGTASPAGAEPDEPAVTVTPSTDLLDGQTVAVSGTGFNSNDTLYVSICLPGASQPIDCDAGAYVVTSTDGTGSFALDYNTVRYPRTVFGSTADCALVECTLGVGDDLSNPVDVVLVPVAFRDTGPVLPPPTVTVTPSTGLVDRQPAAIAVSGLKPFEPAELRMCAPGATAISDCAQPLATISAGSAGSVSFTAALSRVIYDSGPYVDCAVVACTVGVGSQSGLQQVELGFVDPALTVDVDGFATLRDGTDDVVAKATISCDMATPVSIRASIAQPGVEYWYPLFLQECAPGEPLVAFIPTRVVSEDTDDFALGEAEVSISARPTSYLNLNHPATVITDASATVELVDFDAVAESIRVGLEDPSNTELRDQVLEAISRRVAQDPVFRREFAAAILGGA